MGLAHELAGKILISGCGHLKVKLGLEDLLPRLLTYRLLAGDLKSFLSIERRPHFLTMGASLLGSLSFFTTTQHHNRPTALPRERDLGERARGRNCDAFSDVVLKLLYAPSLSPHSIY